MRRHLLVAHGDRGGVPAPPHSTGTPVAGTWPKRARLRALQGPWRSPECPVKMPPPRGCLLWAHASLQPAPANPCVSRLMITPHWLRVNAPWALSEQCGLRGQQSPRFSRERRPLGPCGPMLRPSPLTFLPVLPLCSTTCTPCPPNLLGMSRPMTAHALAPRGYERCVTQHGAFRGRGADLTVA